MTATTARSARNDPAHRAGRVPCPAGCGYTAENQGSIPAHVAMKHPEVPMDTVAPRRSGSAVDDAHFPQAADLIPSAAASAAASAPPAFPPAGGAPSPVELAIADIVVEDNVREDLGDLDQLVESVHELGLLQAVLVDHRPDGAWRLVDGHRRLEACRRAGLERLPVQVAAKAYEAAERTTVQIVANSHRKDLDPIEEARGYAAILERDGITQADLARRLSKAPSTIANALRLLALDEGVIGRIQAGEISASHGRAIASLPPKQQREIVERVVRAKVSSRDLERELEWKRQTADADAAKEKRTAKALPKLVPALEAAKVPRDAVVRLGFNTYSFDVELMRRAVVKAGWTKAVAHGYSPDRPKGCDCTAAELEAKGVAIRSKPVCVDDRHRDRAAGIDRKAEQERQQAIRAKVDDLRGRVRVALEDVPVPILLLAANEPYDLAALIAGAGDESRAELRDLVAQRLARVADSSGEWERGRRAARDRALDELLALFPPVLAEASA